MTITAKIWITIKADTEKSAENVLDYLTDDINGRDFGDAEVRAQSVRTS